MVEKRERVDQAWSQVENVYQRRSDLIPNLVNTVKGAANFEQTTLEKVIQARAEATKVNISVDQLSEENLAKFQQAQAGLSSALSRLMVVSENYPQLKANQNFLALQSELEGTENRITVERRKYNLAVEDYNAYIAKFPQVMFANYFDFKRKPYFKAEQGAQKAPQVNF